MRKWTPAVLIVAAVVFSLSVYTRLPDPMPIHWNMAGEPDGYGSRPVGAFLLPVITLALWGLMLAIPRLDPRGANIEKFRDTYDVFVIATIGVMCVIHVAVVGSVLGWPIPVSRLAPISIGALLVLLGRLLPRFQSNFFFGIRTPWTLSSESVWTRTHRVGGAVIRLMGLILIVAGLLGSMRWLVLAIGGSVAMALGLLVYSYVLWRGETRQS